MCRLCIRITPNPNLSEPALDVMRTQAGDVVAVTEDGHVFSFGELNCGQYRFINVPGEPQAALINLIESVFAADESTMTRVRKVTLPISVLSTGVWKNRTTATKAQIDSITTVRV